MSGMIIYNGDLYSYQDLLRHPKWQRKRLEVMSRDGWECQACKDQESELHVHHKLYVTGRAPWDYDGKHLVTLCAGCHEKAHDQNPPLDDMTKAEKGFLYGKGMGGTFDERLEIVIKSRQEKQRKGAQ